jgi:hypothetical protein
MSPFAPVAEADETGATVATPETAPRTRGPSDPTPPTLLLLDWSASELDIAYSRRTEIFPYPIILTHSLSVKTDRCRRSPTHERAQKWAFFHKTTQERWRGR